MGPQWGLTRLVVEFLLVGGLLLFDDGLQGFAVGGFRHDTIKGGTIVGARKLFYVRAMEITKERGGFVAELKPNWKHSRTGGTFEFEREAVGLDVLIVHEDVPTGVRAREALVNLEQQSEIAVTFLLNLCRFGMLGDPELAESAVGQVAQGASRSISQSPSERRA